MAKTTTLTGSESIVFEGFALSAAAMAGGGGAAGVAETTASPKIKVLN